jgi:putative ABC transport system substrate-binding protein
VRRREFITLLGGAAAAWSLTARAQQPTPVVGFLHTRSPDDTALQVAAFRRGLAENGYVEGQSVTIEYRFAYGEYDQLPALAAELVRRQVAVLVAVGGDPAALAAKSATSTIPIVFAVASDPVKLGLVASYNRPGGNATGMNVLTATLEAKRLGLIHELVPQAATIGFLTNPRFASAEGQVHDVQEAARALALKVRVLPASTEKDIVAAFGTISGESILALAVAIGIVEVADLAARARPPGGASGPQRIPIAPATRRRGDRINPNIRYWG